jgi:hypothetical protein
MTKGVQDRMVEVARARDSFYSAIYSTSRPDATGALTSSVALSVYVIIRAGVSIHAPPTIGPGGRSCSLTAVLGFNVWSSGSKIRR